MRLRAWIVFVAIVATTFAASAPAPSTKSALTFDAWTEALTADWLRVTGAPAADGAAAPDRANPTEEANDNPLESFNVRQQRRLELARRGLAEAQQWDADKLTPSQRVSLAVLRWNLDIIVAGEPFQEHAFVFNQMPGGLHVALVNQLTGTRTPLRTAQNVEAYLDRLGRIPARLDEGIARTRAAAQRGIIPPRFILERAGTQLDTILAPAPAENVFVATFARRIENIKELTPEARAAAVAKATAIVGEKVKPAYARVRGLFDELLPKSTPEAGVSRLPGGAAAYAFALRRFTTTAMTADEIHALGHREIARIEKEMDALLRELGHTAGSVEERFTKIASGTPVPDQPEPRGVILARYTEIIKDAEKRAAPLFNLKPKAGVEVRREPALTERTASAHYGSGIFWAPLPGPTFFFRPGMRSLAYHEAIPGHHYQIASTGESKDLPRFRARRSFGGIAAYSEGWGLYAERLAVEQGWYEGDPVGKLGALSSELFRARRLVVDTGLHAKGWTREQAIAFGISAQEVERYVVNPGQACAYMIGMLAILQEREKARAALGEKFTLPAFHDVMLKNGSLPLAVLTDVIDAWIADQKLMAGRLTTE